MPKRMKILAISVALASLAAFSRCGGGGPSIDKETIREAEALAKVCDIGVPPQPPNAMFDYRDACLGDFQCPPEVKSKVAAWVYELSLWTKEASECAHQAKDVFTE